MQTFSLSSVSGFRRGFSDSRNILRLFKEEGFMMGKKCKAIYLKSAEVRGDPDILKHTCANFPLGKMWFFILLVSMISSPTPPPSCQERLCSGRVTNAYQSCSPRTSRAKRVIFICLHVSDCRGKFWLIF